VDIDPSTPVLVGAGQFSERLDDPDYAARSAVELGAQAARAAIADAGLEPAAIVGLDAVVGVRQFAASHPKSIAPLGRSNNYPRSVADRVGLEPTTAVYDVVGGDSPQRLVGEFGGRIAAGELDTVLLVGSEAMSTARHFAGRDDKPDHGEDRGGQLDERGYDLGDIVSQTGIVHGLIAPPTQYALLEHARRARLGLSREAYAKTMGELFAPFTEVAAANPHAAAPTRRSAAELIEVSPKNRVVADPYPRLLVARDQVNQGAAVLLMSVARARELGVPEDRWVFLAGHAAVTELPVLIRPDFGASAAAGAAFRGAFDAAGITLDEVDFVDLYSCFPIAVFAACDAIGLDPDDPRGLTLTGGLPYFGGAGNNYSMHAIAEVIDRVRNRPGSIGVVAANGGIMSKYAVGVYTTTPHPWRPDEAVAPDGPTVEALDEFTGDAVIETFTLAPFGGQTLGILVCRNDAGARFYAHADPADAVLAEMLADGEPIGRRVRVAPADGRNVARLV